VFFCDKKGDWMDIENPSWVRTIDGDTISMTIWDWHPMFGHEIPIRVRGVQCPGLWDKNPAQAQAAQGAKDFVQAWRMTQTAFRLIDVTRDKYFRFDADVKGITYTEDDPPEEILSDLKDFILTNALGVPYEVPMSNIEEPTVPPLNDTFTANESHLHMDVIHRCIDGDTFICNLAHQPDIYGARIPVRVKGMNANELDDPDPVKAARALACKLRLEELLGEATIINYNEEWRDKFFRVAAYVGVPEGWVHTILIAEDLADPA
jgi:endonuclease YncB( thermonuclease family)